MIVITTPTGNIGSQVLADVLKTNEAVRVIVRDAAKLDSAVKDRAEIVEGSSDDPAIVNKAFSGADTVFWVVPPKADVDDLWVYYRHVNQVAAGAAIAQNIKRIVWVSTLGTEADLGDTSGHLSAAKAADKPLLETGITARILDPATFMDNMLYRVSAIQEQGKLQLPNAADKVMHVVATRDIAAKAAELLVNADWDGVERMPLLSSDNLTPMQMADIISDVLGKPVSFEQLDHQAYKASLIKHGFSNAVAQGMIDMAAAQSNGAYLSEAETAERAPTDFRTWCEEVLKPAVPRSA